eukprot:1347107-Pleurochrysis_carterae.AAC.1
MARQDGTRANSNRITHTHLTTLTRSLVEEQRRGVAAGAYKLDGTAHVRRERELRRDRLVHRISQAELAAARRAPPDHAPVGKQRKRVLPP